MSDRRERVARAIGAILDTKIFYTNYVLADAALAAIDAEPTEADVEAAIRRYRDAVRDTDDARYTYGYSDEQMQMRRLEDEALANLRALISARKAGQ